MLFHYTTVLLHEPCIHKWFPAAHFTPPFIMQPPRAESDTLPDYEWTEQCIRSSHAKCDLFLALDLDDLRSLPLKLPSRVLYCLLLLAKMSLLDHVCPVTNPEMSYRHRSKADKYLSSCIDRFVEAAGVTEYRAPFFIAGMALRLQKWYNYQLQVKKTSESAEDPFYTLAGGADTHPALHMSLPLPVSPPDMAPKVEDNAEHEVLGKYVYQDPDNRLDIDFSEANYFPNFEGVQTYDDLELDIEAEFLAMTQHMSPTASGMRGPSRPT